MTDENRVLVASVSKNSREEIEVAIDRYRGHEVVDVRAWIAGYDGKSTPTKKGLTFRAELIPALIAALQAALDRTEAEGGGGRG